MELRHLRYFVAVAEERHFRRAAERLYIAQPAVSEQIRKLEDELGVRLFDRSHRRVALTAAGEALLVEARQLLRHADVARQAAQSANDQAVMRLRIGYLPTSLPVSVSRALRRLPGSAPSIRIVFRTAPPQRLIDDLRADRVDVVIATLPAATTGLRTQHIEHDRVVVVLPATHAAAHVGETSLARLAPEQLVLLPREADPALHNTVLAMCQQAAIAPRLVELAEASVEQAVLSVAAGAGMTILPASAAERHMLPGVRIVALSDAARPIASAALTRADDTSIATRAFLRALAHAAGPGKQERLVVAA